MFIGCGVVSIIMYAIMEVWTVFLFFVWFIRMFGMIVDLSIMGMFRACL